MGSRTSSRSTCAAHRLWLLSTLVSLVSGQDSLSPPRSRSATSSVASSAGAVSVGEVQPPAPSTLSSALDTRDKSSQSTSLSSSPGVGAAILAGLGESTTTIHIKGSTTVTHVVTVFGTPKSSAVSTPAAPSNPSGDGDCQALQASWSTVTSNLVHEDISTSIETRSVLSRTTAILGYGKAYTTEAGFARAHGNFTPTATTDATSTSFYYITSHITVTPAAFRNVSLPPAPTCKIGPSSCDKLYDAYASSLHATTYSLYRDLPFIYPAPSNSPRCQATINGCKEIRAAQPCSIAGRSAQVFYWPKRASTATITHHEPVTQVVGSITMTSPSIYLSFDELIAHTALKLELCDAGAAIGGESVQLGSTYTNKVFSYAPEDVSTLEAMYSASGASGYSTYPDSALSALQGHDTSAYYEWVSRMSDINNARATARLLNPEELDRPGVRAYYLRPNRDGEVLYGCNVLGPYGGCNTIYEDQYHAMLSIPPDLKALDPAWSACLPGIYGVFDPPTRLTAVASIEEVTATTLSPITTDHAQPASGVPTMLAPSVSVSKISSDDPVSASTANTQSKPEQSPALQTASTSTQVTPQAVELGVDRVKSTDSAAQVIRTTVSPVPSPPSPVSSLEQSFVGLPAFAIDPASDKPITTTVAGSTALGVPASSTPDATGTQSVPPAPAPKTFVFSEQSTSTSPAKPPSNALDVLTKPSEGPVQPPVAVIPAPGTTILATKLSDHILIGSTTITKGQQATVDGVTLSNAGSAVIMLPVSTPVRLPAAISLQTLPGLSTAAVPMSTSQTTHGLSTAAVPAGASQTTNGGIGFVSTAQVLSADMGSTTTTKPSSTESSSTSNLQTSTLRLPPANIAGTSSGVASRPASSTAPVLGSESSMIPAVTALSLLTLIALIMIVAT